jgi:hypothetical protein
MYRLGCTAFASALSAAALVGCSASDPNAVTVTMICGPDGLHLGLMTLTGAACRENPGSNVYFAALTWSSLSPQLPASVIAQLNTLPTTIKCSTKDKSRKGGVVGSFDNSDHTKLPSSPSITFTSNDEAVVCILTNPVIATQPEAGGRLLLGGGWPTDTPLKTETFTCDPKADHDRNIYGGDGSFCPGGEPTSDNIAATRLFGWNAGGEDQLNSTTTTLTCKSQDRSSARALRYGGASHVNGSPDITFTNALGTVCVLSNPAIAPLSVDPISLVLRI